MLVNSLSNNLGLVALENFLESENAEYLFRIFTNSEKNYCVYKDTNIEIYLKGIGDAYLIIKRKKGVENAEILVDHFITFIEKQSAIDSDLTLEKIHNGLIYQKSSSFYNEILNKLVKATENQNASNEKRPLQVSALQKRANFFRRRGHHNQALSLLNRAMEYYLKEVLTQAEPDPESLKELSRTEYDIAYINRLQGNPLEAIKYFDLSALHSNQCEHFLGYCYTRAAMAANLITYRISSYENILAIYDHAENILKRESATGDEQNYVRWRRNISIHKFYLACDRNDPVTAEEIYKRMKSENSPALEEVFDRNMTRVEARWSMLHEKWAEACFNYEKLLELDPILFGERLNEDEFIGALEENARDYYYLGQIYRKLDREDEAQNAFEIGLMCPDYMANSRWHQDIRDIISIN